MRYRLLETIREYAVERLEAAGEAGAVRARHLEFYLRLAEAAEPELTGAAQAVWLARLDGEYDNLRAALEWSFEVRSAESGMRSDPAKASAPTPHSAPRTPHLEAALRLAGALGRYWQIRGAFREGRELLMRALSISDLGFGIADSEPRTAIQRSPIPYPQSQIRNPKSARAKALSWAGFLSLYLSDYATAVALCEEALTLWEAVRETRGLAGTLGCLAIAAKDQGDRETAEARFQASLALWRAAGDRTGIAGTLGYLGILAADREEHALARSFYEDSLALRRELGDTWGIAASLNNLGLLSLRQGDAAAARPLLQESLAIRRQLGDRRCIAISLNNLGLAVLRQSEPATARTLFAESLTLVREIGDRRSVAYSLEAFGRLAAGDRRPTTDHRPPTHDQQWVVGGQWSVVGAERAARLFGAAAALREVIGAPLTPADRAGLEPAVAAARAALGENAFAVAWAEGEAMSLSQAVEYALQDDEDAAPGKAE